MVLQIPKFGQTNTTDIYDVIGLADGRLQMRSIGHGGAEREDEATEIFVQGEKLEHLPRGLGVGRLMLAVLPTRVCSDLFRIQVVHLEDIKGNPALVSPACPLRIQPPCLLVLMDVDRLIKLVQLIGLPPVLRILELAEGICRDEFARAQISQQGLVIVSGRGLLISRMVITLLLT